MRFTPNYCIMFVSPRNLFFFECMTYWSWNWQEAMDAYNIKSDLHLQVIWWLCTPLQLVIFSLVVEIKCNGLIGCCLIHLYDDLFKLFLLTTPPYSKGQLSCLSQLWDTWALLCMSQGYVQGYISHKILSIVAQTFSNESWDLEL